MFTGLRNMYTKVTLAICLVAITTGPIHADTDVDIIETVPDGLTLTKITETLYSLTGGVGLDDCARIVPLLPDHVFTLMLESPGGSLHAGICLADALRAKDVITVIRDTPIIKNGEVIYQPDHDGDGSVVCASACGLLFLAGRSRHFIGDIYFGLHGSGIEANTAGSASMGFTQGVQSAARLIRILRHLDVPEDVQLLILRVPSSDMYYVNPEHFEQMEGLRYLANHYVDFWGYTGTNPHDRLGG